MTRKVSAPKYPRIFASTGLYKSQDAMRRLFLVEIDGSANGRGGCFDRGSRRHPRRLGIFRAHHAATPLRATLRKEKKS